MNFTQSGPTYYGSQGQLWITGPDLERAPQFDDAFISGDNVPPPALGAAKSSHFSGLELSSFSSLPSPSQAEPTSPI